MASFFLIKCWIVTLDCRNDVRSGVSPVIFVAKALLSSCVYGAPWAGRTRLRVKRSP